VSVPVTLVGASNGAIPVYGYTLARQQRGPAPIGTITAAPLTLAATADSKVYDGSAASGGNARRRRPGPAATP
jgi:hypothetical protein